MKQVRFDLVIFDCDGVLVDSEPLVNRIFVGLVAESGVVLDLNDSLRLFSGSSLADRIAIVRDKHGWKAGEDFDVVFHERLAAKSSEVRAVPGVAEMLANLRGPRCVASNGSLQEMKARLGAAGLLALFGDHLFSAFDVPRKKPHPDVFLYAAKTMGVAPGRCAVVEDSIPGVRAAIAAGMTTFGYARVGQEREIAMLGARVFKEMSDLPALLASED